MSPSASAPPTSPSFELAPELREYTGEAGDRKALMAWKKKQADAIQALAQKK